MLKTSLLVTAGLLATLAWYACPIYKPFPAPTGLYTVGTTVTEFSNPSGKELYSENPNEQRTLVVRFFYPSFDKDSKETSNLEKYPYLGAKKCLIMSSILPLNNIYRMLQQNYYYEILLLIHL